MYPELCNLCKFGSEYVNKVIQGLKNPFWKDVLRHFKKLYMRCVPKSVDAFMAECIHYNINILRDKQVIYVKEWVDIGILFVHQLVNVNGDFFVIL